MAFLNFFHSSGTTTTNDRWLEVAYAASIASDSRRQVLPGDSSVTYVIDMLTVVHGTAGSADANNTYTVELDGVDTALVVTVGNGSGAATTDTTNSFTAQGGQSIGVHTAHSATVATAATGVRVSMRVRPQ